MKWMRSSCRNARELLLRTAAQVSKPRLRASSTINEPIKPLAPVIKIFILLNFGCKVTHFSGKIRIFAKNLKESSLQVTELLQNLFQHHPNETFSFKQIFKALKFDTHPLKMLAIDTMEEMAWDDFLSKVSDTSYRLNLKTQVQEGGSVVRRMVVTRFCPTMVVRLCLWQSVTRCRRWTATV